MFSGLTLLELVFTLKPILWVYLFQCSACQHGKPVCESAFREGKSWFLQVKWTDQAAAPSQGGAGWDLLAAANRLKLQFVSNTIIEIREGRIGSGSISQMASVSIKMIQRLTRYLDSQPCSVMMIPVALMRTEVVSLWPSHRAALAFGCQHKRFFFCRGGTWENWPTLVRQSTTLTQQCPEFGQGPGNGRGMGQLIAQWSVLPHLK